MNNTFQAGVAGPDEKKLIIGIYEKMISGRPNSSDPPVSARPSGLETLNAFLTEVGSAFPDYRLNINNLIVKENRVMVRYTISGTHKKDFRGLAPTNTRMDITGIDVFRLDRGRVIEYSDAAHQIGVAR